MTEKKVDPGETEVTKTETVTHDVDYEIDAAGRRPGDPGYDKPVHVRPDNELPDAPPPTTDQDLPDTAEPK